MNSTLTNLQLLAADQQSGSLLGNPLFMIFLMVVMFYFLLIRPQKKQRKELEDRIASMKKGDKVVTIGGMHALVHHISKDTVTLKLSEGVFVPFNKSSIATVDKSGKSEGSAPATETEEAESTAAESTAAPIDKLAKKGK